MAAKPETGTPPIPRRRALQAEQTRRDILAAARRRFAEHGYAATTLKDIATDTGVSVQTIYDSVGNKPELVRQLNDLIDAEAQIGEIVAPLLNETDPLVVARAPARITRRLIERCGDILRAGLAGSYTDDGLAPALEEGSRRHRAGAGMVAAKLASLGALRPGLDAEQAARAAELADEQAALTIAALADTRLALLLIDDHQLTVDQVEDWIADTIVRATLKP